MLAIDPALCWVRHVRLAAPDEDGVTVAAATFVRNPDNLGGAEAGWQEGRASAVLADTGELALTFPNAPGIDGVEHRRRFAYFTDPNYEPGDEWLELYREPDQVVAVCTPYKGRKGTSTIELVGYDVAGYLSKHRGSEFDVWDSHSPRDVFEHYTRLPVITIGADFTGFTGTTPGELWPTTSWAGLGVTVGPHGGPRLDSVTTGFASSLLMHAVPPTTPADCWVAEVRMRNVYNAAGEFRLQVGGHVLQVAGDGDVEVDGKSVGGPYIGKRIGYSALGEVSLRLVVRYDRVFALVNGELVVNYLRALPSTWEQPLVIASNGRIDDVVSVHLETLHPFALRL